MTAIDSTTCPVTWLFTPGTAHRHFDAGARSGAGVSILDLEDAVGVDDKDTARRLVAAFLDDASRHDDPVAVRINRPSSEAGRRDIDALGLVMRAPDIVLVPKVEGIDDLSPTRSLASGLVATIESVRGADALPDLLADGDGPDAIMFGAADTAADLGCGPDADVLRSARDRILLSAARTRTSVIDTPCFDHADDTGLGRAARIAVREGFAGKAAIHPGQITTIAAAFAPSDDEITWAHQVLAVAQRGRGHGGRSDGRRSRRPSSATRSGSRTTRRLTHLSLSDEPSPTERNDDGSPCPGLHRSRVMLFDNATLGMVKAEMLVDGLPDFGVDVAPVDYAAIGAAAGLWSRRVDAPGDVPSAVADALAADGPALVQFVTDPMALSVPPKITGEQLKGFALAMSKVVLNGGVGEAMRMAKSNLRNIPRP